MGAATEIGIYSRVAGVWERMNGGASSDGFDGVNVHTGSVFVDHCFVEVYNSGWLASWTTIDGELSFLDDHWNEFDFSSPFYSEVVWHIRSNGDVQISDNNWNNLSRGSWRTYDCGREYEVKFTETIGGQYTAWDSHPTLNTFLDLTDAATNYEFYLARSATGIEEAKMTVWIQEKITQSGGNDTAILTAKVENEDLK